MFTIYLLIILLILTLPIYALLYNTILKQRLEEIQNYLQCDTNATKNNTNTAIQLQIDLILFNCFESLTIF